MIYLDFPSAAVISPVTAAQNFDGSDDYFRADSILAAGGTTGICSFWFRRDGSGSQEFMKDDGSARCRITCEADDKVRMILQTISSGVLVDVNSGATTITDSNWHHFLSAWHLDVTPTCQFYLDDIDVASFSTGPVAGDVDFANARDTWGAKGSITASDFWDGCLAEFWLDGATSEFDLGTTSNRREFITAGGLPVDLGADGSNPPHGQPEVYFKNDFSDNLGSRISPSAFGTPGACSDSP